MKKDTVNSFKKSNNAGENMCGLHNRSQQTEYKNLPQISKKTNKSMARWAEDTHKEFAR